MRRDENGRDKSSRIARVNMSASRAFGKKEKKKMTNGPHLESLDTFCRGRFCVGSDGPGRAGPGKDPFELRRRNNVGNFRRVDNGARWTHTHTHARTQTRLDVCIKEAWRIGLRLSYRLMLIDALFLLQKARIEAKGKQRQTISDNLTGQK